MKVWTSGRTKPVLMDHRLKSNRKPCETLVTGGAGFLGSHLCEKLLASGKRVICIDNLFTGTEENIAHLFSNPGFEFRKQDVLEPLDSDADEIFNLACPASPVHYACCPVQTIKTCVLGSINVLELARRTGARVFQASTSEVYGDPEVHPQTEEYWGKVNPIGVRSCYDEGKRCAETLFFDYHRQYGVKIKVARIFNTYGPRMRQDDGRVVSNFIVQALAGRDITLYGDGSQTRSFCYVDDLIDAIMLFMETPDDLAGPVNIGNPQETTVKLLAETVLKLCGSKSKTVSAPLPQDDPKQRRPDITKIQALTGWEPATGLEEGLRRTIGYFRGLRLEA